jgi:hypothetical protein
MKKHDDAKIYKQKGAKMVCNGCGGSLLSPSASFTHKYKHEKEKKENVFDEQKRSYRDCFDSGVNYVFCDGCLTNR